MLLGTEGTGRKPGCESEVSPPIIDDTVRLEEGV